ncbi:MAG: hypothetical protein MRZ54_08190 [Clostridiales bacterium]|nr:hypothetical protein [Clostridiales bacterium]
MSEISLEGSVQLPQGENSGSMIRLLQTNLGRQVTAEFWVGSYEIIVKCGILTAVSENYLILYDTESQTDIVCDFYSLRFVTFCAAGARTDAGETADAAQTTLPEASTPIGMQAFSTATRPHAQAALNYTRRKSRKLE